jgi:hypothetical protein
VSERLSITDPEVIAEAWELARHCAAGAITALGQPSSSAVPYLLEAVRRLS